MPWNTAFIQKLQSDAGNLKPIFYVTDRRSLTRQWGSDGLFSATNDFSSYPNANATINPGSVRVNSNRFSLGTLTSSGGGFSFTTPDVGAVLTRCTRGFWYELWVGFAGLSVENHEIVATGVLNQVSFNGSKVARLDFVSVIGALRSRPDSDPDRQEWLYDVQNSVEVTTVIRGTTASFETQGDATGFDFETGGLGALRLDPTSSSGNTTFVTYDTISVDPTTTPDTISFSGLAFGRFGTNSPIGGTRNYTATNLAYLRGHPIDVVRKVMVSTGRGDNGANDVYPESWGFGIPSEWIDTADSNLFRNISGGTDTDWDFVFEQPVSNGLQTLSQSLRNGGFFITQRQGLITVRAVTPDPTTFTYGNEITDADIAQGASAIQYSAWNPDQPIEYGQLRVLIRGTTPLDVNPALASYAEALGIDISGIPFSVLSASDTVGTLPGAERAELDISPWVFANQEDQAAEITGRLRDKFRRVYETVRLRLGGLRWAVLAPGDTVYLTTLRVGGRNQKGATGYSAQESFCTEVSVDWSGGTVDVTLAIRPAYAGTIP